MRPDVEEFFCGISFDAYRLLGSHPAGPGRGWLFTMWAPHARRVQLLGDWNGWDLYSAAELTFCEDGLWRGRCPRRSLGSCTSITFRGRTAAGSCGQTRLPLRLKLCPARLPAWRSRITRSPLPCCAVPAGMLPF